MSGKGSKRRPTLVSSKQVSDNWDTIFGNKESESDKAFNRQIDGLYSDVGFLYYHLKPLPRKSKDDRISDLVKAMEGVKNYEPSKAFQGNYEEMVSEATRRIEREIEKENNGKGVELTEYFTVPVKKSEALETKKKVESNPNFLSWAG